jgi:hypothetical protein
MIDQFEDLMGIVIETGYAPLDKKLNSHICYKGGGGQTTTSESGVPKEFRPYVVEGLKDAEAALKGGDLSYVADLTPQQQQSLDMQTDLATGKLQDIAADSEAARDILGEASRGEGIFGSGAYQTVADDMSDRLITLGDQARGMAQTKSALGGGLGSARQTAATERAVMDTMFDEVSKEVQAQRQGRLGAAQNVIGTGQDVAGQAGLGAAALERVGATYQTQDQRQGDATYQGLQRFFGLLGSPAVGQQTKSTTTSGGGK